MKIKGLFVLGAILVSGCIFSSAAEQQNQPVRIVVEAENMTGVNWKKTGPGTGWQVGNWGTDLYQNMIFGGAWASRTRTAMTDKSDNPSEIYADVEVPRAGTYKLWVKYECPPLFNYAFGVRVENIAAGKVVFDRIYGLLTNEKHFCFMDRPIRGSLYWQWGIDHDAAEGYPVDLQQGKYRIVIYKTKNPQPAGARSIDALMLTSDLSDISSPGYSRYPLLDELRRANHVYFRFRNLSGEPIKISWNHWGHRYPDFYNAMYRELVRFYDGNGNPLDMGKVKNAGDWPEGVPAGATSVWYDLGPTMNVESTSPFTFKATAVTPNSKNEFLPFGVDIALKPDEKSIVKSFDIAPGEGELTVLVQPDLNTEEGCKYTRKISDIFREITVQLNSEKRLGPIPKKLRLFASTGAVTDNWNARWGFDVEQAFRHALGLNTIGYVQNGKQAEEIIAWWKDKGGVIPRSVAYHHSTDIDAIVKYVRDKNLTDYFYYLSYGDEIGLPALDTKNEDTINGFRNFLKAAGETPESLGLSSWEQAKPLSAPSTEIAVQIGVLPAGAQQKAEDTSSILKKLYWYSVLYQEKTGIQQFAQKTAALKKALGNEVQTSANLGGMHPFYWVHQTSFIESFKHDAMSLAWSEDYTYCMPEASALVVDFLASYLRKGASYHDTPMQFYCMPHYPGNTPDLLLKDAVLLWANNVKDLDFFCAAFDGYSTENYIAYRGGMPTFKTLRTISGMAGLIEDFLIPARPESTPVAMLLSQASDVWELDGQSQWAVRPGTTATNVYQEERKNLWTALRKAGYRLDFITENDVIDGLLDNYKVLYISGQNVQRKAAQKIRAWIENGGIAFVTANAARKDEFDMPFTGLDETFGRGKQIEYSAYRGPLRAKIELLFESPLDRIIFKNDSSPVLCCKEKFEHAKDADILARYSSDGAPAWIRHRAGKGIAYVGGTLPAESYIQAGLPVVPMGKGGLSQNFCHFGAGNYEPVECDKVAENLILLPLVENGIMPDVIASHRGVVSGRLKGPGALVIPVVNLAQDADGTLKNVGITVKNLNFTPGKIWSCYYQAGLKYRQEKNTVSITLPSLAAADVIIISR